MNKLTLSFIVIAIAMPVSVVFADLESVPESCDGVMHEDMCYTSKIEVEEGDDLETPYEKVHVENIVSSSCGDDGTGALVCTSVIPTITLYIKQECIGNSVCILNAPLTTLTIGETVKLPTTEVILKLVAVSIDGEPTTATLEITPNPTQVFVCPVGCVCDGDSIDCRDGENPGSVSTKPIGSGSENDPNWSDDDNEKPEDEYEPSTSRSEFELKYITIDSGSGIEIKTTEKIEVREDHISIETSKGIEELPIISIDAIKNISNVYSVDSIELVVEEEKPTYSITGIRQSKLFGIFSKKMKIRSQIDASTGSVISIKKPWWAFLAAE